MLKSKPEELVEAGYPESQVRAFLDAYHELEQAESSSPGHVSEAAAGEVSDRLARAGRSREPHQVSHRRDDRARDPLQRDEPVLAGHLRVWRRRRALAPQPGIRLASTGKSSFPALMGSTIYRIGSAALAVGIALEIYGFYLRVRITGWAPVTNMYETVIWVALVAAVLSFVFEMIYRKVFTALAGSAVALLGTITAANVPLLDPSIKSLQPVLRSNFWLTIHVLTEVSSYAAFGLAWMLGLIATLYYLTATYRRSPRFRDWRFPWSPACSLLAVGGAGVAASYGMFGPQWIDQRRRRAIPSSQPAIGGDALFYLFADHGLAGRDHLPGGPARAGRRGRESS